MRKASEERLEDEQDFLSEREKWNSRDQHRECKDKKPHRQRDIEKRVF